MQVLIGAIKEVLNDTWPMILLSSIIFIFIRMAFLIRNKQRIVVSSELMMLTFVVYILCLFQIVTNSDVSGVHGVNITLFKELTRYQVGTRLFYKNIIGNIIMFIPFGFFVSYYLKLDRKGFLFFITLLVSVVIEAIQLKIGRAFDIDDILLNMVGSFMGYVIYRIIDKALGNLSETLKGTMIVVAIFTLLVFAAILFI